MKGRIVLVGLCGVFILFGLLAAVDSVGEVRDGLAARGWSTVEGEIVRAVARPPRSGLRRLEYRYTVDGQEYVSARAAFVRVPYMRPIHRTYRAGQPIAVYYDPADPTRAVLEPDAPFLGILAEALVPLVMLGFGGAGLFFGLRRD